MMKHPIATLGVIAAMVIPSAVTFAQDRSADPAVTTTTPARADTSMTTFGRTEAGKLIGQSVETTSGDRIGEVEAVHIGPDGKVSNVIVGVGGFLGVGERDVALAWKDLQISDNGSKVVTNLTKSRLETMSSYKYSAPTHRGTVFDGPG